LFISRSPASGISACEQTQTIAVSRRAVTGQGTPLLKRLGRSSTSRASETGTPHRASKTHWKVAQVLTAANHFGHRETDGITVDLFWDRSNREDEFRIEVEDRREGARFALHPVTGREAIQAFYHPFADESRES
jgi:hypothetical protein